MYAKRMNRSQEISTPQEKQAFLARGYDIYDEDDELFEVSPQKTIAFSEFQKLRAASEAMRKELYAVRAENKQLKDQLATLQAAEPPEDGLDTFAAPPPEGVMDAFDAPPTETAMDNASGSGSEGDIKTLRSSGETAPKMGKKK